MATVYLAHDLKRHRRVAIKVLKPELAAVVGLQRFLREIEIGAGLTHPLLQDKWARAAPKTDTARTPKWTPQQS